MEDCVQNVSDVCEWAFGVILGAAKSSCKSTPVTVLSIESPMRVFCITFLKAFTDPLPELFLEPVTYSPCLSNPSLIWVSTQKHHPLKAPYLLCRASRGLKILVSKVSLLRRSTCILKTPIWSGLFFMSEGFVWEVLFLSFLTSVVLKMWLLDMHLSPYFVKNKSLF